MYTCNLGAMAAGATFTAKVKTTTAGGANSDACTANKGRVDNTATVTADPAISKSDPGFWTCTPPPQLAVVKTPDGGTGVFNGKSGYAVGTGTCNKLPATIYFILIDAGEPGTADVAEYHITGGCTLDAGPALLDKGNHQFHKN